MYMYFPFNAPIKLYSVEYMYKDNKINKINNKWEFQWIPQSDSFIHCFQVELGFGNVGFCGGKKTLMMMIIDDAKATSSFEVLI